MELNEEDKICKNGQLFNAMRKKKTFEEKSRKILKLLKEGSDINAKDANDKNNTPLHIAVCKGELEIVKLLLSKGAIADNKNADGKTSLDIAELPNTPNGQEMVNILKGHSQLCDQQISVKPPSLVKSPLEQSQLFELTSIQKQSPWKRRDRDDFIGNEQETLQYYSKRSGTSGLNGQLYETKLLVLLLLRSLNKKEIKEFYLGTNVDGIGAFDDIVFKYKLEGQEKTRFIFLQAKHKDNPDKEKVTVGEVLKKGGDFSLCKYLESYLKIKLRFNLKSKDYLFKDNFGDIDFDFIIYTTAKENFSKKKIIEQLSTKKDDLFYTNKTGKTFQFEYEDDDINLLVKSLSKSYAKLLAESLSKFILSDKDNHSVMMSDDLIKTYHIFLAQNVIEVSSIESEDYYKGKFRSEFFDIKEELLSIFRKTLYKEIVVNYRKKSELNPKDIKNSVNEILEKPSAGTISKLIGSTLTFDAENKRLKFIEKDIPEEIIHLKDGLEKIEVIQETVNRAIEIAGKEKLEELSFKLPSTFGNLNFKVKNTRRLEHLTSKFIELLRNESVTRNNIVKIDEDMVGHGKILNPGDIAVNGGIGGLVGNLLILDKDTNMLKFNNNEELLPKNSKQLLKNLKREISVKKLKDIDLSSYKFEINVSGFPRLSIINEKFDKKLVKDFVEKLVFYTNQAKQDEVEKVAIEEIRKYHKADKKQNEPTFNIKTHVIFLKVHDEVQKWWKQPEKAFYLTKYCKFFDQVEKDVIDSSLLTFLNFIYVHKLKSNNIKFRQDAIQTLKLDKFSGRSIEQILKIITNENILSSVKLAQYFESKNSGCHVFLDLQNVTGYYEKAISEFKEGTLAILIIVCKEHVDGDTNVGKLYKELKGILDNKSSKKIILVTKKYDILAENFKKDFPGKYIEIEDKQNSYIDLSDESQINLQNSKVIFQGEEVSLDILIDGNLKHLIDREVLCKLINNEKVEISKPLTNSRYEDIRDYYINRNFKLVEIKKEFEKAELPSEKLKFFVVDNKQIIKLNPESGQDIVLISDTDDSFKGLCDKFKKHNIHWLKKERNKFIWQRTFGYINKLREFVDKDKSSAILYEPKKITDIKNNVVIIAAESGMGKSTILTHLAVKTKESSPSLWVVRINLLDCSTQLKTQKRNKSKFNEVEAIKFLYQTAGFQLFKEKKEAREKIQVMEDIFSSLTVTGDKINLESAGEKIKGLNLFEIELFNSFYNQGKIALLFDGFDEISPVYKEKVIELLKVLKDTKVEKIWITTRPYDILNYLEDSLNTISYTLKAFSVEDQKSFLENFWKKSLEINEMNNYRFDIFTNELLERFSQSIDDEYREFMGIPLQISMIAKVFQETFKEFYYSKCQKLSYEHIQKLHEKLNLVTLYERFIKIKFYEIRFQEKKPDTNIDDPDMQFMIEREYKIFVESHEKLALFELFKEHKLGKLLSEDLKEIYSLKESIKEGKEKTGIIDRIIDGKLQFIHRTFAEYFAASYLWKKFISIQLDDFQDVFIKGLIECANQQIYKFFLLMAQKDLENINVLDIEYKVKILLKYLVTEIHTYGPQEFNQESVKLLLKIVEFFLSAQEQNDPEFIKDVVKDIKNNKKLALLCVSAEMGYIKLADAVMTVASEQLNIQFLQHYLEGDKWFYSPLWLAAKNGNLDVVQKLIGKLFYETTWKDKDRKILLQRILQRYDFDVLRSCLKLDIIDVSHTYNDFNGGKASPLVDCIRNDAPPDVVKLLIEKTDIDFLNKFKIDQLPAVVHVIGYLNPYSKNLTNSVIEKGIDLNAGYDEGATPINVIAYEFKYSSITVPSFFLGKPTFFRYFFYTDKEFSKFFNLVKTLVEFGAIYNLEDCYSNTPLQYVKQTHYIHKLLDAVFQRAEKENDKVSNVLDKISDKILQLMIKDSENFPNCFQGYKISVDSREKKIAFLPIYDCSMLQSYFKNCPIKRYLISEKCFAPDYIQSLFFETYTKSDSEGRQIKITLIELFFYIEKYRKEIEYLKSGGYTVSDILEKLQNKENSSINNSVMIMLERVMKLYIDQNYEIDEALTEVSEEASKLSQKMQYYIKKLQQIGKKDVYKIDEVLNILNLKDINIENDLMLKIQECNDLNFLNDVLIRLNNIGQKYKIEVLKSMLEFSQHSSKTFELLKNIDDLFNAVSTNNKENFVNILQNAESSFLKAAVNVCNKQKQTLLDLAYEYFNVEIITLLRKYGAKFSNDYLETFSGSQVQSCLNIS